MSAIDVFVSSTCYDLTDLRAELGAYLRDHAFLVRMSDEYDSAFAVTPHVDSVESCLENVRRADVIICIIDRRYGPKLPAIHKYKDISATHAELVVADTLGKPVFNFIRKTTFIEAGQIALNADFEPGWIDRKSKADVADLVTKRKTLADASKNNWVDIFDTSADLRPRVLKRLLDHFPAHAGAYARKPDRLVRLYFDYRSSLADGRTGGTFINVGNGPAIDVTCGWQANGADQIWATQGGLAVLAPLKGREGDMLMACPPRRSDVCIFCEYSNSSGDRYRVEVALRWTANGYVREGTDKFFVWIGEWRRV